MTNLALRVSFIVGFLSLSQEIVWVRLVGFGHGGRPHAFSIVLAAFLLGIAIGALVGRWRCRSASNLVKDLGFFLVWAGLIDILILFFSPFALLPNGMSMILLSVFVLITAALKGVAFPIVHQLGTQVIDNKKLGRSVSRIYAANVIGSTVGPLVTGFVLLNFFIAGQVFALIGLATSLVGLYIGYRDHWSSRQLRVMSAFLVVALGGTLVTPFDPLVHVASRAGPKSEVSTMIQSRQGIVHLATTDDGGGNITYGGNVYDGRTSTDLSKNLNRLDRAYLLAVLHPKPRRVLVVGLSTGAWTRVVAGFEGVEQIDVVEINPAYLALVRDSTEFSALMNDSRIRFYVDDARRWLRANPHKKYDLIVQNTTFHWRAYATMMLSSDYFLEIRQHLNPGGISAVNTTGSLDVYYTATKVFNHVLRYENFAYMSDTPMLRHANAEKALRNAKLGVNLAFSPPILSTNGIGDKLLSQSLESASDYLEKHKSNIAPELITDINLVPELRHGKASPIPWLINLLPPNVER
jgi:spermidine synthase